MRGLAEKQQQQQMFLAKALYDNVAEAPDELAFRRGDVIKVLDQDTGGLDGWWLCSLGNRRGIAPGNRLKILSGMVESDQPHALRDQAGGEWRRSLEKSPNKVVTPVRKGDIYLYSQPDRSVEDYDVPPSRYFPSSKEPSPEPGHDIYDTPTNLPVVANTTVNNSEECPVYDTPQPSQQLSSLPGSQRASMDSLSSACSQSIRLSMEGGPQQFHTAPSSRRVSADSWTKRLSGEEGLYQTPPSSKRASLERVLSQEQPIYDTPVQGARSLDLPGEATYDTPSPGARSLDLPGEATYDTPSPNSRRHSRDSTGAGSRGSVLSYASSESGISGSSSNMVPGNTTSLPDSARSSLDASLHDTYDLLPSESRARKQLSMDSGLGLYDPSQMTRQQSPSSQCAHVAASLSHSQLVDYGREDRPADIKRSRSLEHALDDVYDSPRNNAPKVNLKSSGLALSPPTIASHDPNALYDIPPQVTRDSVISMRSDSSEESLRLSSCSTDSRGSGNDYAALTEGVYAELMLDLDSAVELLVKRQQDVSRASAKLVAFVSPTWRSKQSLQTQIYDIKVACGEFKKVMGEFMEFAHGTLANSVRVSDKTLISRLVKLITPLQQHRKAFSAALRSLEEVKWQVAILADEAESEPGASQDSLGTVMTLAKELGPEVKKLASFIQTNSSLLFKRSSDLSSGGENSVVVSKPPIGPKPDFLSKVASAGGGNGVGVVIQRPRSVQQRPLPAPPVPLSDRPLPPTPHNSRLPDLAGTLDSLNDYINGDGVRSRVVDDDDDDGDRDYSDLQLDYDYVQLDARDEEPEKQSQTPQKPALKDVEEEETETLNMSSPTSDCYTKADEKPDSGVDDIDGKMESVPPPETICTDVNDKHPDIDKIPTKESADQHVPSQEDSNSCVMPQPGSPEEVKTPMSQANGFNVLGQNLAPGFVDFSRTTLSPNDKQVLVYYSGQFETHSTLLTNAIDAFFNCIEGNEPPKVFISNSKFVIVTAHKLVYISDALHRNLINSEVRTKVMHCANHVCECLKISVQATKTAALQYPSVPAVQEMVDRVVDVSHAAHELKLVITQAAAL